MLRQWIAKQREEREGDDGLAVRSMALELAPDQFYDIRHPKNFYRAMRDDTKVLWEHKAYLSMTTVIVCSLDALAAVKGESKKSYFISFVEDHFPLLCSELEILLPRKGGAKTLYEEYRNGFAHSRRPNNALGIAEEHEVKGAWAECLKISGTGRQIVCLNVDRLAREFLSLLDRLEAEALAGTV